MGFIEGINLLNTNTVLASMRLCSGYDYGYGSGSGYGWGDGSGSADGDDYQLWLIDR